MRIFTYVVIALSILSIIFNTTKIDFNKPFEGESTVALICVIASLCAIIIMMLYNVAKKVDEQTK